MLWIDFVNSMAHDALGRGPDRDCLDDPAWMAQLAERWQLQPHQIRSRRDRDRLRGLRKLLAEMTRCLIRGEAVSSRDLETLNEYLRSRPVQPRLSRQDGQYQLELLPRATGVEAWLFAVAASFSHFLVSQDPSRLKCCGNQDCAWVFFDTTRSRTRRWCATSCGDLIKVREFRQRHKKRQRR